MKTGSTIRHGAAVLMLAALGALSGPFACASPDADTEPVGEAEQAVGVGGYCSAYYGDYCDSGLTCCGGFFSGICRNLQNDPNNCGTCGHPCVAYACESGVCANHCFTNADCNTDSGYVCNSGACTRPG